MSESMTTEHKLKAWPQYFDAVKRGDKPFEVRRDDRGFQKGDILVLQRTSQEAPYYVQYESDGSQFGKRPVELRKRITYVLTGGQLGIEPGYVVLGLADCDPEAA